jgi:hypothetical protein
MFLLHIGTRIELVQTKIDLEKTTAKNVVDLTLKLNGTFILLYWKIWNHKPNLNKTLFLSDSTRIGTSKNHHRKFVNGTCR